MKFRTLALLVALSLAACTRQVATDEKLPQTKGPPPVVERDSQLLLTASIPLSEIETALDEALPRVEPLDRKLRVKLPLLKDPRISLKGEIRRSALALRTAPPQFAFATTLRGEGNAPVRWIVRGRAQGTLLPSIDPDYKLHSNLRSDLELDEAKLRLDGLPDISVRGELEDEYGKAMQRAVERLDRRLNHKIKLGTEAATLWASAYGVAQPSKRDPLYLVYRPTQLYVANPRVSADARLTFGLGLRAQVRAYAGAEPRAPTPAALPPPNLVKPFAPNFHIVVPLIVDVAAVCEAMSKALHEERVRIEKHQARVLNVEGAVVGERLLLRLKLKSGAWRQPIEARVFVSAVPYLDAQAHELRIRDLRYTVESSAALRRAGAWLGSPSFIAKLEQRARMPLAPLEARAKRAAEKLAVDLQRKSGGLVSVRVDAVTIEALSLLDGYVIVDASARGSTRTHLGRWLAEQRERKPSPR